jgi:hypothetical protein
MLKGEITDANGKFQLTALENATYLLDISALGQKRFISVPLTLSEGRNVIALPVIILLPAKSVALKKWWSKLKSR